MKNIVFIGSSSFGLKCLKTLLDIEGIKVSGVVTAPQTFSISYNKQGVKNVLHANVGDLCEEKNIPVIEISDGMKGDNLFNTVSSWVPDMFIVCGWYHMVPKRWRDLAPAYGLHASLLPAYSGGAPLVWAIINGEKETGITFFQFEEGVDSGVIIGQVGTPINNDDTIATLYARIEDLGLDLIKKYVPKLSSGSAELKVQDEAARTVFPQRSPEDGKIDWNQDAFRIYDFIRAQTRPYPGAFAMVSGKKISIWSASPAKIMSKILPGQIHVAANDVYVGCANGSAVKILSVSLDGQDIPMSDAVNILNSEGHFDA